MNAITFSKGMLVKLAILSLVVLATGCEKKQGPYFAGSGIAAMSSPLPIRLSPSDANQAGILSDDQIIHIDTALQAGDTLDIYLCPSSGLSSTVKGSCKLFQNGDGTMVIVGSGTVHLVKALSSGYGNFWIDRQPHEIN